MHDLNHEKVAKLFSPLTIDSLRLLTQQRSKANYLYLTKQITMKKNMGSMDRIIRVIMAAIVFALYYTGTITGTLGIVLIVLAAVFVLTSLVSVCPLYLPFGLSTLMRKKNV